MENLLKLVKSLKFLEAVSYVIATVAFIYFPEHAVPEAVILGLVLSVLKMFGIQPELQLRELLAASTKAKAKAKK